MCFGGKNSFLYGGVVCLHRIHNLIILARTEQKSTSQMGHFIPGKVSTVIQTYEIILPGLILFGLSSQAAARRFLTEWDSGFFTCNTFLALVNGLTTCISAVTFSPVSVGPSKKYCQLQWGNLKKNSASRFPYGGRGSKWITKIPGKRATSPCRRTGLPPIQRRQKGQCVHFPNSNEV